MHTPRHIHTIIAHITTPTHAHDVALLLTGGTLQELAEEQKKLNKLIPLSAAASGTMVGSAQLETLTQTLCKHVEESIAVEMNKNQLLSSTADVSGHVEGLLPYNWGGRRRACRSDFMLDRGERMMSCWVAWWCGESGSMPLRKLLNSEHIGDARSALKNAGIAAKEVSRLLYDRKTTMTYLESLLELADPPLFLKLCSASTASARFDYQQAAFAIVVKKFSAVLTAYKQQQGAGTNLRKHDFSRVTVRSVLRHISNLKK